MHESNETLVLTSITDILMGVENVKKLEISEKCESVLYICVCILTF